MQNSANNTKYCYDLEITTYCCFSKSDLSIHSATHFYNHLSCTLGHRCCCDDTSSSQDDLFI